MNRGVSTKLRFFCILLALARILKSTHKEQKECLSSPHLAVLFCISANFSLLMDSRKVIGSRVVAKACHVTSLSECSCRYGRNKKTKEVVGTVVAVEESKTAT